MPLTKNLVLVFSLLLSCALSAYTYLDYGKPFCVMEKQISGKPIVLKYQNYDLFLYKPDYDSNEELNAKLYVISPLGTHFMETNAKDVGKMVFTPYEVGYYQICFELSIPLPAEFWEYGNPLRFYFEIERDIVKPNMTTLAKTSDITQIDVTVNSLVNVLKEMTKEMEYQNVKEKEMHDEDDSDNRMILLWSLLEAIVMIVVAVIQVSSIRRVLKKKQIIQ